jgi:transposase
MKAGRVRLEQRVSTTAKALREEFGGTPGSRVALETGTHSPWVSRLLTELGHEVIVAHARNVRLIGESRKKDESAGCADVGTTDADRSAVAMSGEAPEQFKRVRKPFSDKSTLSSFRLD